MFGAVMDDEQRLKLRRVQAFMTAAEGYGDHVMHALGAQMLPSYARIDEAMRRYRETEQVDPVFERLLGIEVKREQYRLGRRLLRHGRRAHRRGDAGEDVGLGRGAPVDARARGTTPVARSQRLTADAPETLERRRVSGQVSGILTRR